MKVQGPPKERSSQSCKRCSTHLLSDVAFDHWPTHKCNRALRRAYLMTRRQEYLRVIALSRRDEDRVHFLVLPRSSALLHWPLPPLRVFWIFEEFPVHLSLDPFFAQHVHRRSGVNYKFLVFWIFRTACWRYPGFGRRVECISFLLFEFIDILCQVPGIFAGASLLFRGFVLRSFLEFWSPRNSLLKYTFQHDSLRWTLSFPNFCGMHRGLGDVDSVI